MGTPAPTLAETSALAFSSDISDLFFNLDHSANRGGDEIGGFDKANLLEETEWFLDSLRRLGVGCLPTGEHLVQDFLKRV